MLADLKIMFSLWQNVKKRPVFCIGGNVFCILYEKPPLFVYHIYFYWFSLVGSCVMWLSGKL